MDLGKLGGHKYKVYIPETPKWKIEAIAKFKSQQSRKRKAPSYSNSSYYNNSNNNNNNNSNFVSTSSVSLLTNREIMIDKQMKLDDIHLKCYEIAKEVNALNTVRHSLIWLLKKATLYETNLNHA